MSSIAKILTISTAHITAQDNSLLRKEYYTVWGVFFDLTPKPQLIEETGGYEEEPDCASGYFVHCSEDVRDGLGEADIQVMLDYGWSKAMIDIQVYAWSQGCEYLRLDPDGDIVEELPTYEW